MKDKIKQWFKTKGLRSELKKANETIKMYEERHIHDKEMMQSYADIFVAKNQEMENWINSEKKVYIDDTTRTITRLKNNIKQLRDENKRLIEKRKNKTTN